jgi:phage tail tape-measure protein
MTLTCPKCQSDRIHTHDYAKRTCGAVGTVAGAVAGASGCIGGAEIGATAGFVAGPAGIVVGGIAGAIIGGLLGGAAGCAAGVKLGEVVDDHVLDNYHCLACLYTFSKNRASSDDSKNRGYPYQQDHPHDIDQDPDLLGHTEHPTYR